MEGNNRPPSNQPLQAMFTAVPPRYDLINRVITMGMDRRWRRLAVETCLQRDVKSILDIGCGTGDLAIALAVMTSPDIDIKGLDYSPPMLERAREKAAAAGVEKRVEFIRGSADRLPFPDSSLDLVAISFAFRNLTYKNPLRLPHLAEVRRVLKAGGRYVIVESSQPANRLIRAVFHLYLRCFVRPAGSLLSGNRGAYRYLAESAEHFYSPGEVRDMLLGAGFREVSYRPLFFGAAGITVATR